jgi:hypothetical protein
MLAETHAGYPFRGRSIAPDRRGQDDRSGPRSPVGGKLSARKLAER